LTTCRRQRDAVRKRQASCCRVICHCATEVLWVKSKNFVGAEICNFPWTAEGTYYKTRIKAPPVCDRSNAAASDKTDDTLRKKKRMLGL